MAASLLLTVTDGVSLLQQFEFAGRTVWTVGRATDCDLQLPSDEPHRIISRHHCRLDIDPPVVRVRDLGSRNGTFVNGRNIGQPGGAGDESCLLPGLPEAELHPGDSLRVGNVALQITLATPEDLVQGPLADVR
jgi:pSer/pThr/pTyr-binding forkhead associated (FHA) protein